MLVIVNYIAHNNHPKGMVIQLKIDIKPHPLVGSIFKLSKLLLIIKMQLAGS